MRFNKVHLAWFGNKSGMEAVDRAHGEVFAQVVSKDGSTGYYSQIIVRADSPFAKLDDIEREVIMLREYEQLSYGEIAAVMRAPVNTVRSRLFRARMAMRSHLQPGRAAQTPTHATPMEGEA